MGLVVAAPTTFVAQADPLRQLLDKLMTQAGRAKLWRWFQRLIAPHADPAPDWMIKALDDPAVFLKYAQSGIGLRRKTLEFEKVQTKKDLIANLPAPLP